MLKRKIQSKITEWIQKGNEALLLTGARQTGKTYIIRKCLEEAGCDFVELNFIDNPEYVTIFNQARDAKDVLLRLSVATDHNLTKGETIFFLDEVQECKEIVTKIKFLVEDASYRYILSGSLLGIELSDIHSAPVGYLRTLDLYPLDFEEFAQANGIHEETFSYLGDCFDQQEPVDAFVHEKILSLFYLYLIVGGMPRAVSEYLKTNDLQKTTEIHQMIIRLYKQDFTKYEQRNKLKLCEIYDAMPSELNQPNKRFHMNKLGTGVNYDRIENAFLWLKDAGVALPVYNLKEPCLPFVMNAHRNLFKLFFSDVGLLTSLYSNATKLKILSKDKDINKGALFENVVAQEFKAHGLPLYYFNRKGQGELDFVIELDGEVIPIEVKSGKCYKRHNALNHVLSNENYGIQKAFILSNENVKKEGNKLYLPIYMTMFIQNKELLNPIYKLDLTGL